MKFLNNKAMSMLEMFVVLGISSMVVVQFMQIKSMQTQLQIQNAQDVDINLFQNKINTILVDNASCDETFTNVNRLYTSTDPLIIRDTKAGRTYAGGDTFGEITIQSIVTEVEQAPNAQNIALININLNIEKKVSATKTRDITKQVTIQALVDGATNNVLSCYTDMDSMIESACTTLGGTMNGNSCEDIDGTRIQDNTITADQIGDNAVTSSEIADGSVSSADIQDGSITSTDIQDGTIATGDLDGSISIGSSLELYNCPRANVAGICNNGCNGQTVSGAGNTCTYRTQRCRGSVGKNGCTAGYECTGPVVTMDCDTAI